MKTTKRVLCFLLTLCMVLGIVPAMCLVSWADETENEINLAPKYAKSMIMITRGDKANGLTLFTNGEIDDTDAGYYTLGGGSGYWCDDDGNALPIEENPAVVEVNMGEPMEITAINVGFLTPGECYEGERYYHWEAYASNDNTLAISEWTKVAEKKNNEIADADGCKIALDTPGEYQYIRIYGVYNSAIADGGWRGGFIHVNEVEIWGPEPVKEAPAYRNLAPNSVISKGDGVNVTADLANGLVDNEPGGDYWSAYGYECIEDPIANNSGAWFSVDLGDVYSIDKVKVFERVASGDTLLDYYTNWEVYGTTDIDAPLTEWVKLGEKKTEDKVRAEGYATEFEATNVRYLRIYGTKTTSTASDYFQLCEIEVWGIEAETSGSVNIMSNGIATVRKSDRDVTPELTNGITDIDFYDDYWSAYGTPSDSSVEEEHSWFEMNLGGIYAVDSVTVIERLTDGSNNLLDYYTNWELYASLDGDAPISEWKKVGEKKNEDKVNVEGYTVEFEAPVVTQYLRVYCTKTTSEASTKFQLTELEAWGVPSDAPVPEKPPVVYEEDFATPEGAVNRAQGEGVVISKDDGVDVTGDLADGKVDTDAGGDYWSAYGYSCIENPIENGSGAWFSVDLGAVYTVDAITVIGRMGEYFHHFEIYGTGDEDAALEGWVKLGEKKTDEVISRYGYTVELEEATEIRYLRIYGTKTTSKMSTYFQLCEIEVWDYNPTDYTAPETPDDDTAQGNTVTFPPAVAGDEVDPDENKGTVTPDNDTDNTDIPDNTDTKDEGDNSMTVIIVIAVIAIAAIGAGVWFATKKKKA